MLIMDVSLLLQYIHYTVRRVAKSHADGRHDAILTCQWVWLV
jgi:hypothetical protein